MFGPLGIPALFLILVVEVNSAGSPAVTIEERPPGLIAWLLTTLGLDTLTSLTVTDPQVAFKS